MRIIFLVFSVLYSYTASAMTIYYVNDGDLSYKWVDITGDQRMEWISVNDNLPINNECILMTYNDLVMEGEFTNGKFYYPSTCAHVKGYCNCQEEEGITHWMPLPQPPSFKDGND